MKKGISALLVLVILLGIPFHGFAQQVPESNEIKVYVNDTKIDFDVPPIFVKNFTMVPVRAVFEALGARVDWDEQTRTVIISRDRIEIRLQPESRLAMVNNTPYLMDVPAMGINGRILVPVRFVSEALRAKVDWVNETKTVFITDLKEQADLGNIQNGGRFASDGSYFYHVLADGVLVRENIITGQKEKISDNIIGDLFIINDRIYCIGKDKGTGKVIRMKKDGSEKEIIVDKPVNSIQIVNNWIYYSETGNETVLFRTKTDGSGTSEVTENGDFSYKKWFVSNGWVYYTDIHGATVYRVRIDGSDKKVLTGGVSSERSLNGKIYSLKLIDGDYLYFVVNEGITGTDNKKYTPGMYRIPVSGGEPAGITEKIPLSVNSDENWLFLTVENNGSYSLIRCRKDGSEVFTINEYKKGDIPKQIYLYGSLIFYTVVRGGENPEELLFSMGKNGDNIQQYTWVYGKDYSTVKKIIADAYSAHKSLDSMNTVQTLTMDRGNQVSSIISEYRIVRSKSLFYKKTLTGEQSYSELWLDRENLYTRKNDEQHWSISKISKAEAAEIQKTVFDFIQPTDELCNNLIVEETDNIYILKGTGAFASFSNGVLPLLNPDSNVVPDLVELEIKINKQRMYIQELSLSVKYGIINDKTGETILATDNYNFKNSQFNTAYLNIPYTVSQSINAKENADKNIASGLEKLNQGKYEEAIRFFDSAIRIYNKSYQAYLYKGNSLYSLGKYQEAILTYNQYHEFNPSDAEVFALIGMCYFKLGDYAKAEEMGRKTLGQISSAVAYNLLGSIASASKDYGTAKEYFSRAVALDSRNHTSQMNLVSTLYTMGSYSRCIEAANRALVYFPRDREFMYYKAQSLTGLGRHEEAIKVYEDILSDNPSNDFVTMTYIAKEYETLQNYQKAKEYAEKAKAIYPDYSLIKFLLEKLDYDLSVSAAGKLADFIKKNYLYYNENMNKEFEAILKKGNMLTVDDVKNLVNTVKKADDSLTKVLAGYEYDSAINPDNSQPVKKRQEENYVYIRLENLYPGTGVRFREIVQDTENPSEKILIIDLRNNNSGISDEANIILDTLLGECTPSYRIERDGYVSIYSSDKWHTPFRKIGILVNENTASSAELLTLGLKTFAENVTIIGRKTAGKGAGQVIYIDRTRKFAVLLTNHYWNVLQNNIEGKGIDPDIYVDENDPDYSKAIEKFTEEK